MTNHVLVTDYAWPDLEIERGIFSEFDLEIVTAVEGDEKELKTLAQKVDPVAIMTNWKIVSAAVLAHAPRCKVVARYGVGVDNIDIDYATKNGVMVTNVPDYCYQEVADHVMAMLLACARNLVPLATDTRRGGWDLHHSGRPFARLADQKLGIVGFGLIGRAVAQRALGFGLKPLAYTPRLTAGDVPRGVTATQNLDELLTNSDYVSLNLPANPQTAGLVDSQFLAKMKPTAYLINTARGAIIDETALYTALTTGQIRGAALDVLQKEAPHTQNPLLTLDNVIVTPHAAFYSPAAIAELQHKAASQVIMALHGKTPTYLVNGE